MVKRNFTLIRGGLGAASSIEPLIHHRDIVMSYEEKRALGFLLQIYGTLIGAGLYTDYRLVFGTDGTLGMSMRSAGCTNSSDHRWMAFKQDSKTGYWQFNYRSLFLADPKLDALAQNAHAQIALLEKRDLPALLGPISMGVCTENRMILR